MRSAIYHESKIAPSTKNRRGSSCYPVRWTHGDKDAEDSDEEIMRNLLLVLALSAVLASCSSTPELTPEQQRADREEKYLLAVEGSPGSTLDDPTLLKIGWAVCDNGSGFTDSYMRDLIAHRPGSTPALADSSMSAARVILCPEKPRVAGTFSAPIPGVPPASAASPAGSAATMTDGTWEVGVDAQPGKYKTAGGSQCYWARLRRNDGGTGDIIQNNLGAGPQTVTVKAGEYLQSKRCGTWSKVG